MDADCLIYALWYQKRYDEAYKASPNVSGGSDYAFKGEECINSVCVCVWIICDLYSHFNLFCS